MASCKSRLSARRSGASCWCGRAALQSVSAPANGVTAIARQKCHNHPGDAGKGLFELIGVAGKGLVDLATR